MNAEIDTLLKNYRKIKPEVLAPIELLLGDTPAWPKLRSSLLGVLGMNGFEKELLTFLKGEICERANK